MNDMKEATEVVRKPTELSIVARKWTPAVGTAAFCWVAMALGFLGLRILLQERPQFVGRPLHFSSAELIQESPQIIMRKVRDDVSAVQPTQADRMDVLFTLTERKDYRGLKTVIDMTAEFKGTYTITNAYDEPIFALFRCPHPRGSNERSPINTGGLSIEAGASGMSETTAEAWYWSGEIEPNQSRQITVSYQAANLSGIRYSISSEREIPIKSHRVEIKYENPDHLYIESSRGRKIPAQNSTVWERGDFLPPDYYVASLSVNRSLYSSLGQLLEIGPLISVLFLISTLSVVMARGPITPLQVMTISAGYAFYFPLILYLSALFRFNIALLMAALIPGILLLNYTRWFLGVVRGLFGGIVFLALFQIFPTLAAFAGWNRGLVLLCLGIATLFVLINLQNQAMKKALIALVFLTGISHAGSTRAESVRVLIPGEVVSPLLDAKNVRLEQPLLFFGPASYEMSINGRYAELSASFSVEVAQTNRAPVNLFNEPVFLISWEHPEAIRMISSTNLYQVQGVRQDSGEMKLVYRVPIEKSGDRNSAVIPALNTPSGILRFESDRSDIEFKDGALWRKTSELGTTRYEVGLVGSKSLTVTWPSETGSPESPDAQKGNIYGIKIVESRQLTVIHSDGACTHLAEFILPPYHSEEFQLMLPDEARVISVSVDDSEVAKPKLTQNSCSIPLAPYPPTSENRRISLRLSLPSVRLGFLGFTELELPNLNANIGTLKWFIVLPSSFHTQIITSGLDLRKSDPEELTDFGDFGRVLKTNPTISLSKNLVAPRTIKTRLKYSQHIEGMTEDLEPASE